MNSQIVCVPAAPSDAPANFLLKPAPASKKYRNRKHPNHPSSPPAARRRTSYSRHPRTPLSPCSSFLNLVDTPSTAGRHSPRSASTLPYLFTPSPHSSTKVQGRAFDGSIVLRSPLLHVVSDNTSNKTSTFQVSESTHSRRVHNYKSSGQQQEHNLHFLGSDPYAHLLPTSPTRAPSFTNVYKTPLSSKLVTSFFFDHSPPSSPAGRSPRSRNRSASSSQPNTPNGARKRGLSFTNPLRIPIIKMSSSQHTSSSSSHSSSNVSKTPTSKKHSSKKSDKVLPFTTSQISEIDRLLGNSDAAKGKKPSNHSSHSHGPEDKRYIAPYVPLGGSAPSGTRSLGRDGVPHPTSVGVTNLRERQVAEGSSIPYFRDENGVLWSGQDEQDEYASLIPEERRRTKGRHSPQPLDWRKFSAAPSSIDSSHSPLSAVSKDSFEVGYGSGQEDFSYDEAVMIPEGGARNVYASTTLGGLSKSGTRLAVSTRGGESFPVPLDASIDPLSQGPVARPRGADRRRLPGHSTLPSSSANSSSTSLGIAPRVGAAVNPPMDVDGKHEFFADAFHPTPRQSPVAPNYNFDFSALPKTPKTPMSGRLQRHSISSTFFSNLGHGNVGNTQSTAPGYLPPMGGPSAYTGIRQSSFSSPLSPSAPTPAFLSQMPKLPTNSHERDLKKKASKGVLGSLWRKKTSNN